MQQTQVVPSEKRKNFALKIWVRCLSELAKPDRPTWGDESRDAALAQIEKSLEEYDAE